MDITPRKLINIYRRFERAHCLLLQGHVASIIQLRNENQPLKLCSVGKKILGWPKKIRFTLNTQRNYVMNDNIKKLSERSTTCLYSRKISDSFFFLPHLFSLETRYSRSLYYNICFTTDPLVD